MQREVNFTKISLFIVLAAVIVIAISYFASPLLFPIGWGAFLWLVPPVFGVPGVVMAIKGYKRNKTAPALVLIIINITLILWFFGFWPLGIILFGP